ncbi:type VII secretion integral membrane protein EccD [Mycobacterium sp. pW045]|uniref:type VII secretion integral membrane protein EccD n=1 Tax=Mycobacterium sp. pW045 TaxID=3238984 RepID=UPI00351B3298
MAGADSGLRRVAVYADTGHADLALPAAVPVALLVGAVVDLVSGSDGPQPASGPAGPLPLRPYRLAQPGRPPLDGSKTLGQQGICDGAVLVLTCADDVAPKPRFDDPAEQVAAGARAATHPWRPTARRLTAALAASGLAGVAGFVAVPGGPGAPNVLLAMAAAATVAAMAVPSSGCGEPARAILCCLAGLVILAAVAGMAGVATGVSVQALGAVAAAGGIGLTRVASRIAMLGAGLSQRPTASRAVAARDLLCGLIAGATAAVVLGAAGVAAGKPVGGVPSLVGAAFVVAAGTALLLRARSHTDAAQIATLLVGGAAAMGIAVLSAALATAPHRPWPAVVAVAASGAAVVLGFTAPIRSPLARRGAEVLEGVALGALLPLACWLCGLYGAVRGLNLG